MKRSFMDEVSEDALMRRKIAANEVGAHKALSGLSEKFRNGVEWHGPETPVDRDDMTVRMMRLPNDEANPMQDISLGFADRRKHRGPSEDVSTETVRSSSTERSFSK
jgi:hypothetical protein